MRAAFLLVLLLAAAAAAATAAAAAATAAAAVGAIDAEADRVAAVWLEQEVESECSLSRFGPWSKCSRSCGGGTATRVRSILSTPAGGRSACPGLREQRECNLNPCAVACRVAPWGPYSSCPAPCRAKGIATRTRFVLVQPAFGGRQCPALVQLAPCVGSCTPTPAVQQEREVEERANGRAAQRAARAGQREPTVSAAAVASSAPHVRRRRADRIEQDEALAVEGADSARLLAREEALRETKRALLLRQLHALGPPKRVAGIGMEYSTAAGGLGARLGTTGVGSARSLSLERGSSDNDNDSNARAPILWPAPSPQGEVSGSEARAQVQRLRDVRELMVGGRAPDSMMGDQAFADASLAIAMGVAPASEGGGSNWWAEQLHRGDMLDFGGAGNAAMAHETTLLEAEAAGIAAAEAQHIRSAAREAELVPAVLEAPLGVWQGAADRTLLVPAVALASDRSAAAMASPPPGSLADGTVGSIDAPLTSSGKISPKPKKYKRVKRRLLSTATEYKKVQRRRLASAADDILVGLHGPQCARSDRLSDGSLRSVNSADDKCNAAGEPAHSAPPPLDTETTASPEAVAHSTSGTPHWTKQLSFEVEAEDGSTLIVHDGKMITKGPERFKVTQTGMFLTWHTVLYFSVGCVFVLLVCLYIIARFFGFEFTQRSLPRVLSGQLGSSDNTASVHAARAADPTRGDAASDSIVPGAHGHATVAETDAAMPDQVKHVTRGPGDCGDLGGENTTALNESTSSMLGDYLGDILFSRPASEPGAFVDEWGVTWVGVTGTDDEDDDAGMGGEAGAERRVVQRTSSAASEPSGISEAHSQNDGWFFLTELTLSEDEANQDSPSAASFGSPVASPISGSPRRPTNSASRKFKCSPEADGIVIGHASHPSGLAPIDTAFRGGSAQEPPQPILPAQRAVQNALEVHQLRQQLEHLQQQQREHPMAPLSSPRSLGETGRSRSMGNLEKGAFTPPHTPLSPLSPSVSSVQPAPLLRQTQQHASLLLAELPGSSLIASKARPALNQSLSVPHSPVLGPAHPPASPSLRASAAVFTPSRPGSPMTPSMLARRGSGSSIGSGSGSATSSPSRTARTLSTRSSTRPSPSQGAGERLAQLPPPLELGASAGPEQSAEMTSTPDMGDPAAQGWHSSGIEADRTSSTHGSPAVATYGDSDVDEEAMQFLCMIDEDETDRHHAPAGSASGADHDPKLSAAALTPYSDSPATAVPSSSASTLSRQPSLSASSTTSLATGMPTAPAPPRKVGMMEVRNGRYAADFEQTRQVGAGGFGKVFLARSRLDAREYAVKMVRLSSGTERRLRKMLREMQVLADLNHVNVVRYYQAWLEDEVDTADAMGVLDEEAEEAFTGTKLSNSMKAAGSSNSVTALAALRERGGGKDSGAAPAGAPRSDSAEGDSIGAHNYGTAWAPGDVGRRQMASVSFAGDLSVAQDPGSGATQGSSSDERSGDSADEDDEFDADRTIGGDMTFGDASRSWGGFAFQSSSGVPADPANCSGDGACGIESAGIPGDGGGGCDSSDPSMGGEERRPASAECCEAPRPRLTLQAVSRDAVPQSCLQVSSAGEASAGDDHSYVRSESIAQSHQAEHLAARGDAEWEKRSPPDASAGSGLALDMGIVNAPKKTYDLMLYIQMEFCSQRTLREHLDPPASPAPETLAGAGAAQEASTPEVPERDLNETLLFMTQISSALNYIHSRKLIHRDLKPGNIFKVPARQQLIWPGAQCCCQQI